MIAHKVGQEIFCHCYIQSGLDRPSFLCQGTILEVNSSVYKILITGINTFSITCPVSSKAIKGLLGKIVPRNDTQIQTGLGDIAIKLYQKGEWICWEKEKIQRIVKQQEHKKKWKTKQNSPQKSKSPQMTEKKQH